MRTHLLFGCLGLTVVLAVPFADARDDSPAPASTEAPELQLKPRWQIGQRWIVETTSRAIQASEGQPRTGKPVEWEFLVSKREKVGDTPCFRVEVSCKNVPEAPKTFLWVDERSLTLRQVETGLVVQGEVRRIKERFDVEDGQPSPVIAPLSGVPIDLPHFSTVRPRGGKYGYQARSVGANDQPANDVTFAVEVEQKLTPARLVEARGLLREEGTPEKKMPATYEVRLKSPEREVRQLWRPGSPWPVYSDNGTTRARLIKVVAPTPKP